MFLPERLRRLLGRDDSLVLTPLLVLFVALALVGRGVDAFGGASGDENLYLFFARNLTHGHYAQLGSAHADLYLWHGPGLPLLLAPLVALHVPLTVTRLIGPLALFGAVVLLHRTLRRETTPRVALAGAVALGLYAPLWTLLPYLRNEPVAILAVVALIFGLVRHRTTKSRRHLLLAGGALGYLVLLRVEYGYIVGLLLVLTLVLLVRRSLRPATLPITGVLAVALLVTTPWLIYTHSITGKVFYWGNSGGSNLYWMAAPYTGARGDWHSEIEVQSDPQLAAHRPFFRHLHSLPALEQDAAMRHQATHWIRDHPATYASHVLANAGRLVANAPYSFKPLSPIRSAVYALPALALIAALAWAGSDGERRRRWRRPEVALLVALAVLSVVLHLAVAAEPRLLMPLVPVALWLVARAVGGAPHGAARRSVIPPDAYATIAERA